MPSWAYPLVMTPGSGKGARRPSLRFPRGVSLLPQVWKSHREERWFFGNLWMFPMGDLQDPRGFSLKFRPKK